jgi:putative hydrolase of the HAD superfamily
VAVRAVFFDAGETLVHPHPSFPELLALVLQEEGFAVEAPKIRERLTVVSERFLKAARENELWSTSAEKSRAFWSSVYRTFLGELGIPWTDRLAQRLYETFTDLSNYRLFPDVLNVLELLGDRGLQLGLVSNFEEWLEKLLESLDVARFFEVRVISGVEGVEKPDPKIFRLALDRMAVEPEDAVYVGDSVQFDVEPATSIGMTGILLDRRNRFPDHPGARISSLDQLPALLER